MLIYLCQILMFQDVFFFSLYNVWISLAFNIFEFDLIDILSIPSFALFPHVQRCHLPADELFIWCKGVDLVLSVSIWVWHVDVIKDFVSKTSSIVVIKVQCCNATKSHLDINLGNPDVSFFFFKFVSIVE